MKKKITGFQRKYLVYAGGLLLIAILLSSVSVWYYMRKNMMGIVTDQYRFRNEKLGMALDNLFQTSDKVLEECIFNDQVQESLKAKPLAEVDKNSLSKYFAYINLNAVSEYCYVDNKQNIYTRSYSKLTYDKFATSGLLEHLGNSYANTVWFLAKDTLFGNGEQALYLGRKVHSLEYAHEPQHIDETVGTGGRDQVRCRGAERKSGRWNAVCISSGGDRLYSIYDRAGACFNEGQQTGGIGAACDLSVRHRICRCAQYLFFKADHKADLGHQQGNDGV